MSNKLKTDLHSFGINNMEGAVHLRGLDLRPSSRGEIIPNPFNQPLIPNHYSTSEDMENAVDMLLYMYEIYKEIKSINADNVELWSPPEEILKRQDRAALFKFISDYPNTTCHWMGGCKMAPMGNNPETQQGVVDARLHVHGVNNLMVVDTSIIPVSTALPLASAIAIAARAHTYASN
jgi:choline dehydrogenase-like flavoprotein